MNRPVKMGLNLLAFFATFAFVLSANDVHASTLSERSVAIEAVNAALDARDSTVEKLSSRDLRRVSQKTLNTVVDEALYTLRTEGYSDVADEQEKTWNQKFFDFLLRRSVTDLGDHRPLLRWLAQFHKILEATIGSKRAHEGILGDVYDLNYAIPVVFNPTGDWRSNSVRRDTVEYADHFIPLAGIVTYWTTRLACDRVMWSHGATKEARKICPTIAQKLRDASERHVAPKVAEFVFLKANGIDASLKITDRDLVYLDARDLLDSIGTK